MKKILILSKESRGGIGQFFKQIHLVNKLKRKPLIIDFYLYKKDPFAPTFDFKVINNKYPSDNHFSYYKAIIFLKNIIYTYKLLIKKKPDIIFTADLYSSILILFLKITFQKNLIVICLINTNLIRAIREKPNSLYRLLLTASTKKLYRYVNRFVFTSTRLANFTKNSLGLKNNYVIFYPISIKDKLNNKTNIDIKLPKKTNIFRIISVGRLEHPKNLKTIIKALSLLKSKVNNIRLFIIGEGSQKEELMRYAKSLKIINRVNFFGWKRNVFPYLNASDIFVFSSFHEGFGRVLIEAMTCGLPIISTNTSFGPSEILENGKYGIIVPVNDAKKMSRAILALYKNKFLRSKYSKLSKIRSKFFSLQNSLSQFDKIFLF